MPSFLHVMFPWNMKRGQLHLSNLIIITTTTGTVMLMTMTVFACLGESKALFCCQVNLQGNIILVWYRPASPASRAW